MYSFFRRTYANIETTIQIVIALIFISKLTEKLMDLLLNILTSIVIFTSELTKISSELFLSIVKMHIAFIYDIVPLVSVAILIFIIYNVFAYLDHCTITVFDQIGTYIDNMFGKLGQTQSV